MAAMYRLPRLVDAPQVLHLPTSMYLMDTLNTCCHRDLGSTYYSPNQAAAALLEVRQEAVKSEGVAALEVRQEALLERLQQLRQQLDHLLSNKVAVNTQSSSTAIIGAAALSSPVKRSTVHDLVISASPEAPPFSLLLLRRLLKTAGISVYCANHLHSSVSQVSERLQHWFMDQDPDGRSSCRVAFTLHWKDARVPSLMVDPLRQTPISGEVNIVRYVSRLFPLSSPYNYEASGTFATITETDHVLDQLSRQLTEGNNRERQAALRQLNARLGKTGWLMGTSCSIVDVLAWSLMRQKAMVDAGAPANVVKWYKTVNTLADLGESW
ncbi:hypothetical protein OTU49_004787 [Cherax quadricarinatus]|uniref:Aminoacyl tRNA synthase complex-interacting multifunctional protein 2 n=1 Tax=Cherax quadricarinatus TaxID=27406 RepID=A0AAW0WY74_CHEQU